MRMLRMVSGTCWLTLPTATRFSTWARSIRFWKTRVMANSRGVTSTSSRPRPRLFTKMTARMLTTLHTSTAMLMTPEANRASTVSTSLTNRELVTPGAWAEK